MSGHEKINFVELPEHDRDKAKAFFGTVFDWSFTDQGPGCGAFTNAGLDGGFFKPDLAAATKRQRARS